MATRDEIYAFLELFHQKMRVFNILFRDDRQKNTQTLATLGITAIDKRTILEQLCAEDYCEGPLQDTLYKGSDMWVFGKEVKQNEVYIKISIGHPQSSVICISFHIAEHPMIFPLKGVSK